MGIIALVKQASAKRILYSLHALDEMNAEPEIITTNEIKVCYKPWRNN